LSQFYAGKEKAARIIYAHSSRRENEYRNRSGERIIS
jgi:hypothetical protein